MDFLERLIGSLPGSPPEISARGNLLSATAKAPTSEEAFADAYRSVVTTGAVPKSESVEGLTATVHGEFDDPERRTPMALENDGDLIYLLGPLTSDLVDRNHEKLIGEIMIAASRDGLLNAAHAVTQAGFLTALAQMAILKGKGARFWIPDDIDAESALFSSSPGRIICIVERSEEIRFADMCVARYVPLQRIGVVDGNVLELQDHFTVPVGALHA